EVLDAIAETTRSVLLKAAATPARIGVGMPGPVEPATGVVAKAPNLSGFDGPIDVRTELEQRLGVDVVVDNDVNVATYGEQQLGAAQGVANVLGLFVGTGVGGGLVLDGELRRGPHGLAGEIGHLLAGLPTDGQLPTTVESLAGRAALTDRASNDPRSTTLFDGAVDGRVRSKAWASAYRAKDPVVVELVDGAADVLALAIIAVSLVVDIEMVVIGGGLAERLGAGLRSCIEQRVADWSFVELDVCITASGLGDESGACGAALLR
ncbi:MAG: ROK family protein, partial [Acidobacteria bacterium]|nr:ROK family protein [Acidobacteriota bacterium]